MSTVFFNTLVPALLHTLWIGLAASLALFIALSITPARATQTRYALTIIALAIILLGGLAAYEWASPAPAAKPPAPIVSAEASPAIPNSQNVSSVHTAVRADDTEAAFRIEWRVWLGAVWLLGCGVGVARLLGISIGLRRLVKSCAPVDHPAALKLFEELKRAAGVGRRIALLAGSRVVQPAAAGILRPMIFLPASYLTGLPEWQLRAILAHELAHITRHDFLVNTLQMLAETLLFFNPAVWWISHRIREEREACCDALAAQWIQSDRELAETLIEQAALTASALPAFADSSESALKTRVLRLLRPSHRPRVKLPLKTFLLALVITAATLALAKKGTEEVVGYLKRIQALNEIHVEHDDPSKTIERNAIHLFDEVTIEIPVRISRDIPSLFPAAIYIQTGPANHGIVLDLSERNMVERSGDRALFRMHQRKTWSKIGFIDHFTIEGHYIARCESTGAAADEHGIIRLPEVTLQPGFEGTLRFITSHGEPVTNVTATGGGQTKYSRLQKNGNFHTLKHCPQTPIDIQIFPPDGYVNETRRITFEHNQITDWVLRPGVPFSGTIVSQQGVPVEGVDIRLAGGPKQVWPWRVNEYPVIATTDASGHFIFTRMTAQDPYNLLIITDGFMGKSTGLITARESGRTFTLMPQKKIEIRVENMQLLKRRDVEYSTSFRIRPHGSMGTRLPEAWCRLVSSNSTSAVYELSNLWEGDGQYARNNMFRIGGISQEFDPLKIGDTLTIDIAEKLPPEKRAVPHTFTIRLVPPNDEPLPEGSLEILHYKDFGGYPASFSIPPSGIVHANLVANPKSEVRLSSEAITGYKVDHAFTADSTNMVIDVPLIPTGCIMVTCTDKEGNPYEEYSVYTETLNPQGVVGFHTPSATDTIYINESIELNRKCRVRVSKSTPDGKMSTEYQTDWFTLTDSNPLKKIDCSLRNPSNLHNAMKEGAQ